MLVNKFDMLVLIKCRVMGVTSGTLVCSFAVVTPVINAAVVDLDSTNIELEDFSNFIHFFPLENVLCIVLDQLHELHVFEENIGNKSFQMSMSSVVVLMQHLAG